MNQLFFKLLSLLPVGRRKDITPYIILWLILDIPVCLASRPNYLTARITWHAFYGGGCLSDIIWLIPTQSIVHRSMDLKHFRQMSFDCIFTSVVSIVSGSWKTFSIGAASFASLSLNESSSVSASTSQEVWQFFLNL